MCNKETRISLKPSRKTRTKTRKPKFLSLLRLDTSPETSQQSTDEMIQHHQLNLFPLHPENLVEDKDLHDDTNMAAMECIFSDTGATTLTGLLDSKTEDTSVAKRISSEEDSISPSLKYAYGEQDNEEEDGAIVRTAYLFSSDTGGPGATTLTGLLDSKTEETSVAGRISSEEDSISPPSLTYAYGGQDEEEGALVRTALRNRERDASEEKWVCYSEVVEEKKAEEEVTSCAASAPNNRTTQQRLSLKLDYQEILNAWSDKGPLFIEGECPQTVPDLHDRHQIPSHDILMDGLWTVPEKSNIKVEEVNEGGGGDGVWKMGQREASVLRYKEKRQSRLFSKRIRYEVRKLNAEKRPRMKGRFVKRS